MRIAHGVQLAPAIRDLEHEHNVGFAHQCAAAVAVAQAVAIGKIHAGAKIDYRRAKRLGQRH